MNIIIHGRIPSKKNCKRAFVIRGRAIITDNPAYTKWHKEQIGKLKAVKQCFAQELSQPVRSIAMTLYAPDNRKSDLSNKFESIADILVDAGILKDDNWFEMPSVHLYFGGVDKLHPRAEIAINPSTELSLVTEIDGKEVTTNIKTI